MEEVNGIRLPSTTATDTDNPIECTNKDDSGKKIKWKCASHFSDQGTHPIGADNLPPHIPNTDDPQTSNSSAPPRERCVYGSKCYRFLLKHNNYHIKIQFFYIYEIFYVF